MSSNDHRYSKLESSDDVESDPGFDHGLSSSSSSSPGRRHLRSYARFVTPTTIVLVLTNLIFASLWLRSSYFSSHHQNGSDEQCIRPQLTFSGARENHAIEYERKRLWRPLDNNPFTGGPRPEHDEAWAQIIEPLTTLVTPEEYEHADLGTSTLRLADGSGYVGELSVYHELHCIKRIRHWLAKDHYFPNITALDDKLEGIHIDHCLEYWREAAMCRADATLATFFWRDGIPTSRVWADHECVNWNKFDDWARSRMIIVRDPEELDQTDRWKYIRNSDGKTVFREHPEIEAHP